MVGDLEQMIKERLLNELIDRMSDDDRMKPKGVGVEVQAKDPASLKEGLDKAKDLVGKADMPPDPAPSSEDDDERRMLELLGSDDDEDKEY